MTDSDINLARVHVAILAGAWLLATILVMMAVSIAPTIAPSPITAEYLGNLQGAWAWYLASYTLFFVTDCAIAMLGVTLCVWLKPASTLVAGMIVILFAVAGLLGLLSDIQMLAAAQAFRNGSPLLSPEAAPAFLAGLTDTYNWLSAGSFFPPGIALFLLCGPAREAEVSRSWIDLTFVLALYQIAIGILSIVSFLVQDSVVIEISALSTGIGLPVLSIPWLVWMLSEMSNSTPPPLRR
ncbi:hypothetical protein ABLE91_08635 [Aquabacter sp. CN5-332]|uniref:hypothetical protein n=1 Tax=Aquabacter sp. CN5-332 TaxID=3156608 RepID=UPI0032B44087